MSHHLFRRPSGAFTNYEFDEKRGEIIPHGAMTDTEIAEALSLHIPSKKPDLASALTAKLDEVIASLDRATAVLSAIQETAASSDASAMDALTAKLDQIIVLLEARATPAKEKEPERPTSDDPAQPDEPTENRDEVG